jgi:pimeloyl-ACP methyl ester carboxylesterase
VLLAAGVAAAVAAISLTAVGWAQADTAPAAPTTGIDWATCAGPSADLGKQGLQCATVSVPMDYSRPDGPKITIAISERPADDPAHKLGVLFTNPGGPGEDGLWMPLQYGAMQPIGKYYDVIGMDPRGVGQSTPLNCDGAGLPAPAGIPSRPTDAELPVAGESAKIFEQACAKGGGDYRQYVTTPNTARDMDYIRSLLGVDKINYLGVSYGTYLGAYYGQMFPEHLNRSVLDSALDPNTTWHAQDYDTVHSVKYNFDAWARWVADRDGVFHLGDTAADVRASVDRLADAVRTKPVAGFNDQTSFDESFGVFTRYRPLWASFAKNLSGALAELNGAKPNPALADSDARAMAAATKSDANSDLFNGVYQAVTCEWDWPTDLDGYYRDMARVRDTFPYSGTVNSMAPTNCAFRSFTPEPLQPIGPRQYPEGLVVQAQGDTNTAYVDGVAMADTLDNALISVPNDGTHGQYNQIPHDGQILKPNTCVNDRVNSYLIDGVLPPSRTSCATSSPPAAIPPTSTPIDVDGLIPDLGQLTQDLLGDLLPVNGLNRR